MSAPPRAVSTFQTEASHVDIGPGGVRGQDEAPTSRPNLHLRVRPKAAGGARRRLPQGRGRASRGTGQGEVRSRNMERYYQQT